MADKDNPTKDDGWAGAQVAVPDDVAAAAQEDADAPAESMTGRPRWVNMFVWQTLWKAVIVGLTVFVGLAIVWRTQTLIRMLLVSLFFALAMIPAVKYMHERWGWKRGAAVGAIYLGFIVFMIALVAFMIPAAVDFADEVSGQGGSFAETINGYSQDLIGEDIPSGHASWLRVGNPRCKSGIKTIQVDRHIKRTVQFFVWNFVELLGAQHRNAMLFAEVALLR